ncbi:MAG TPA: ABC transporter permease [Spirochaetia bacterium]|nr:ABC transporter permease [Spirochaetia bacterium]
MTAMRSFTSTLSTEFLKLRRNRITWVTLAFYAVGPLAAALFMVIIKDPEFARRAGLANQKAHLMVSTADWPSYLSLILEMAIMFGIVLIGAIIAYVFGREYTEQTAKNMLALPVRREWFVSGKLIVTTVWFVALVAIVLTESILVGLLLGLPGFDGGLLLATIGNIAAVSGLALLLSPVFGWIAVATKGYLAPIGATMLALILANVMAQTGWGKWFPWSILGLFLGVTGPRSETLSTGSYGVIAIVCLLGVLGTMVHMRRADNTQ